MFCVCFVNWVYFDVIFYVFCVLLSFGIVVRIIYYVIKEFVSEIKYVYLMCFVCLVFE